MELSFSFMPGRISILGIPIDRVTLTEARDAVLHLLSLPGQHHVMTPNPEMLVEARKNPPFREVLLRSALNVPDGAGLLFAARLQGSSFPERVSGVDLLSALCASPNAPTIFLLGASAGVAEDAAAALRQRNASLRVAGTFAGSPFVVEETAIVNRINASGASLLFVAYGAPAQDLWIARNLQRMPRVRVAMGVGGSFDFIAGVRHRAPSWMRKVGLEWLWRFLQEPRRLRRIVRAVIVFPLLVFLAGVPHEPQPIDRSHDRSRA
jgi:N-acetylglucosaminyldiphosphoundecaprenol N-acetyl-beta-D-mannosaminyltransferase